MVQGVAMGQEKVLECRTTRAMECTCGPQNHEHSPAARQGLMHTGCRPGPRALKQEGKEWLHEGEPTSYSKRQ